MLGLWMLFDADGAPLQVPFVDEEKLEVLTCVAAAEFMRHDGETIGR